MAYTALVRTAALLRQQRERYGRHAGAIGADQLFDPIRLVQHALQVEGERMQWGRARRADPAAQGHVPGVARLADVRRPAAQLGVGGRLSWRLALPTGDQRRLLPARRCRGAHGEIHEELPDRRGGRILHQLRQPILQVPQVAAQCGQGEVRAACGRRIRCDAGKGQRRGRGGAVGAGGRAELAHIRCRRQHQFAGARRVVVDRRYRYVEAAKGAAAAIVRLRRRDDEGGCERAAQRGGYGDVGRQCAVIAAGGGLLGGVGEGGVGAGRLRDGGVHRHRGYRVVDVVAGGVGAVHHQVARLLSAEGLERPREQPAPAH